jgi:hypothetical protein
MTDVVFFAGPVVVTAAFQQIDWLGRDVRIVPIVGSGSSYFSNLAEQLRAPDGRILPGLVRRYAGSLDIDKLALAAYSAGHGLLNKIADNDADRQAVDAMVLSDATFNAFNTGPKSGYVKFGVDAARGNRLFVATTANTTSGGHMTGRDSFQLVWDEVDKATWSRTRVVPPRRPVPEPSGGWHRMGSLFYWGDYWSGATNDISHEAHHHLAPAVWQAYLAPYLAGRLTVPGWAWGALGALAAAGGALALRRYKRRGVR